MGTDCFLDIWKIWILYIGSDMLRKKQAWKLPREDTFGHISISSSLLPSFSICVQTDRQTGANSAKNNSLFLNKDSKNITWVRGHILQHIFLEEAQFVNNAWKSLHNLHISLTARGPLSVTYTCLKGIPGGFHSYHLA